MFQFLGYDFFSGPNALRSAPGEASNITSTKLTNAIYDNFDITRDVTLFGEKDFSQWTYDTILNADFNNNIFGGNLQYLIDQISGVKIKRRAKGEFDWLSLKYIPVNDVEDLNFVFNDFLNAYGTEYEYTLVPVVNDIEGDYIINSIMSKFNGVFIGDAKQAFNFLYDVQFSSNARNQQVGTFQPLGNKYPIIVANGVLSYESGSVSASVLNDDYEETGEVKKTEIVKKKNAIKDFLTNKKPKILKDWNGNIWLVMITDSIQVEYRQGSGMAIPQVSFNWNEIGDSTNKFDLYKSGLIDFIE